MKTLAVLQFVQNKTKFGSRASFNIYINDDAPINIQGGCVTNIGLSVTGKFHVRAEIDGYFSPTTIVNARSGDIISLLIHPPADRSARILGLWENKNSYLSIKQLGVQKTKSNFIKKIWNYITVK